MRKPAIPVTDASPWKPFEDRRRDHDLKRSAVLQMAARCFLDRGFTGTKLSDVADALNITKPALYHYFPSKEAILDECYRLGLELIETHSRRIGASKVKGIEKVRNFIVAYTTEVVTVEYGMCLGRLDDRALSPQTRKRVRSSKRRVDRQLRAFIAEGIADGSIVPGDPKLHSFAIAGALNWIAHWYQAGGELKPTDIAAHYAELLTNGMATRSGTQARKRKAE